MMTMQLIKKILLLILVVSCVTGCTKVDYTKIDEPAYLRVFNNFNYGFSLGDKDKKVPFLCMIINPTFDAEGKPNGGQIVGDFLDVRDYYAPPYPSHVGSSTSVNNPEYPGKENVLVGPIVNGYDLSSWAQIPSGTHRFVFFYRPKNSVPYFKLDRNLIGDVMKDTTLTLTHHEVYTMHLLQKDYLTKENGVLLRQETFLKQPLSDSLAYVNFYNYSASGFQESSDDIKPEVFKMGQFQYGIKDKMDIFLTIYSDQVSALTDGGRYRFNAIPGYKGKYFASVERNISSAAVASYHSYPVFPNPAENGNVTQSWQMWDFLSPGMNPANKPYHVMDTKTDGNWASLACLNLGLEKPNPHNGAVLPNMLVNIHSGVHNPRTFATVNTIEVINGGVYLTTIQRKYPAPVY
jgi:hypothetical protein